MLENIISKETIPADGVQRQWDIPFTFYKIADVGFYVSYDNGKTIEKITQNIRYEKDGNYFVYPTEESKLPVLPVGATVLLLRETENKQFETSETFPFNSKDIERMADNLTMQIQDLKRDSLRSVKSSLFSEETGEEFAERFFEKADEAIESASKAQKSANDAEKSNQESLLNAQNAASSAVLATSASESAREYANAAKNDADRAEEAKVNNEEVLAAAEAFATRSENASEESKKYSEDAKQSVIDAEQFAISAAASAESAKNSADLAEELIKDLDTGVYTKEEIDNKITVINSAVLGNAEAIQKTRSDFMESDSELQQQINAHATEIATNKNDIDGLGDEVAEIESKIPEGTSDTNPLINKQQLLDEEMDIREDMMQSDSELQTQINALEEAVQGGGGSVPDNVYTQDNLIAGKNVTFTEVPPEGGIDEHTIDVFHFDEDVFNSSNTPLGELGKLSLYVSRYDTYTSNSAGKFGKCINGSNSNGNLRLDFLNGSLPQNTPHTIDFWYYPMQDRTGMQENIANNGDWFLMNYNNKLYFRTANVSGQDIYVESTTTLELYKWHHIAFTTDGTYNRTVYLNGKPEIKVDNISPDTNDLNGRFYLYIFKSAYVDELRVSDVVRYTEEFTPPTKAYTVATGPSKTAVNAVVAVPTKTSELENDNGVFTKDTLLGGKDIEIVPEPVEGGIDEYTLGVGHFDGSSPSQNDVEGKDAFYASAGLVRNEYAKFGTKSVVPNTSYTIRYSNTGLKEDSDWTVDQWARFYSNTSNHWAQLFVGYDSRQYDWGVKFRTDTQTAYVLNNSTGTEVTKVSAPITLPINEWVHLAAEKHGNTINGYLNGVKVISYTDSSVKNTMSYRYLQIYDLCYTDELRFSTIARYKGQNFTPPTEAYRVAVPTGNMVVNFVGKSESGASRNIGEVYYSQSSLATDNSGALPLFTGESIASANTIYPEFYSWVESHTELQTTAEEYETSLSTYGECSKYVISNGTLRLPKHKISERYLISSKSATSSDPNWYNLYSDGWLEQGGKLTFPDASVTDVVFPKPFADTNYIWTQGQMTKNFANAQFCNGWGLESYSETGFRVANSTNGTNEIAWAACGQSSLASGGKIEYPWVSTYTSSIEASSAQAAEFQQGLSGKADTNLGNIPTNYDYVVESYKDGTNWYRVYKSGWIEQGGTTDSLTGDIEVNLLKPFADANYTLLVSADTPNVVCTTHHRDKTETLFYSWVGGTNGAAQTAKRAWYACGQGA